MAQFKENMKCPGVKRLMREAAELAQPTEHYHAAPLEENLFEWHFTGTVNQQSALVLKKHNSFICLVL